MPSMPRRYSHHRLPDEMTVGAWFIIWLVMVVPVVCWIWWYGNPPPPRDALTQSERDRYVQVASEANSVLLGHVGPPTRESLKPAIRAYWGLHRNLPDEALPIRNLAVALLEDAQLQQGIDREMGRTGEFEKNYERTKLQLEFVFEHLDRVGDLTAARFLLEGECETRFPREGSPLRLIEIYEQACRADPESQIAKAALLLAAADHDPPIRTDSVRRESKRAYELNRRNLVFLLNYLALQVDSKEPQLVETLVDAKGRLRSLEAELFSAGNEADSVDRVLERCVEGVSQRDWSRVRTNILYLDREGKKTNSYKKDLSAFTYEPRDSVLKRFSDWFYGIDLDEVENSGSFSREDHVY